MPRNIGTIDQVIRAILGLAFIAYIGKDEIVTPDAGLALLAGVYLFATAIFLRCPLYSASGFTTFGTSGSLGLKPGRLEVTLSPLSSGFPISSASIRHPRSGLRASMA